MTNDLKTKENIPMFWIFHFLSYLTDFVLYAHNLIFTIWIKKVLKLKLYLYF